MAMVDVANRHQPGENGRRTSRHLIPPTGTDGTAGAISTDGADEPPIRVTISVDANTLVLCRHVRRTRAPGGHARHRKATAPSWPALLGAIFSDWGWTLRAAFIVGEVLCAALGALALAAHFVAAGTGVFGTGAAALVLTAVVRRRTAKSPAAKG
ncbi:hypothetical protein OG943_06905 [Amycolatopsis sp. NBC_00345]|uniref:hypothetical protein n=1 Tax=Amycolatopsis sp. NBC_00345 TaxID=2975955 RepID=UPI002E258C30